DEVLRKGEEILVKLAKEADPDAVHRACDYIQRLVHEDDDPHDPDGSAATFAKRQVTLSRLGELWRLSGTLAAETGAYLKTVLEAFTPPPGEGDERSAAQRRHDALAEWARDTLREGRTLPLVEYAHRSGCCCRCGCSWRSTTSVATPGPA